MKKIPPLFLFFITMFVGISLSRWFFFDPLYLILFYTMFIALFIIFLFFNLLTKKTTMIILMMIFFLTGIVLVKPFEELEEGPCTLVGKVYRVTDTSVRLTNVKALEEGVWKSKSGEFYAILPDNDMIKENEYFAINGQNSKLGNINFVRAFIPGDYFSYRYLSSPYEKIRAIFQEFSDSFVTFLKKTTGDENGAIASAVFLGLGLDKETKNMINEAGISYLFVVSGFHFFLIYFLFRWIVSYLKIGYFSSFVIRIIFLTVFFMTCSTGPSSFRAYLMLTLYELLHDVDYPVSPLSVVGLSGIILLMGDPTIALNAGFQMTYGAVLGILLLSKITPKESGTLQRLVPLGSLLFIMPITALNFGVVPLLSIPIGLLLSITLIPFIMICLFIVIILFALQLQQIALIFLKGLNPLLTLCSKIIEWLANHYGTIAVSDFTAAFVAFGSLGLMLIIFYIMKKGTPTNSVVKNYDIN
jgi:competence protein ComEC